jgi:hypothetical protein
MPTYTRSRTFIRDYRRLTQDQQSRLRAALEQFIADLEAMEAGERYRFHPSLRVKRVRGSRGLYEMTWDYDGRATFSWGDSPVRGKLHIVWHRCGDHSIL